MDEDTVFTNQAYNISELNVLSDDKSFVSHKALEQYIEVNGQLGLCAAMKTIAQKNQETRKPVRLR